MKRVYERWDGLTLRTGSAAISYGEPTVAVCRRCGATAFCAPVWRPIDQRGVVPLCAACVERWAAL